MSLPSASDNKAVTAAEHTSKRSLLGLYLQLTKARLSALAVLSAAVGFVMGSADTAGIDWVRLWWTIVGTALAAGAANALNQLVEMRRDGLMTRTHQRPLPSGALGTAHSFIFSMLMAYAGLAILGILVNLASAALALATIAFYILLYTPLKTRTTLNTMVGAACGAIPPLIGWVGAAGTLDSRAWVLAGLLFVWQIPHFFALAWLHRDDYDRGGFAMLPAVDRCGRLTGQVVLLTSFSLLPLGLTVTLAGLSGVVYAGGSVLLGAWMLGLAARMYAKRTREDARRLFLGSIIYLPLLLCLMMADRISVGDAAPGPQASADVFEAPSGRSIPELVAH